MPGSAVSVAPSVADRSDHELPITEAHAVRYPLSVQLRPGPGRVDVDVGIAVAVQGLTTLIARRPKPFRTTVRHGHDSQSMAIAVRLAMISRTRAVWPGVLSVAPPGRVIVGVFAEQWHSTQAIDSGVVNGDPHPLRLSIPFSAPDSSEPVRDVRLAGSGRFRPDALNPSDNSKRQTRRNRQTRNRP